MKWAVILGGVAAALVLPASAIAASSLSQFVVLPGEETGFVPAKTQSDASIKAYVHGDSRKQAKEETKQLRAEGFVAARFEFTHDATLHAEGLSSVVELGSPAQADRWLADELRTDIAAQGKNAHVHRFSVAGVPGAKGFDAKDGTNPQAASNVLWREGKCVLLVGDFLPKGSITALTAPVKAGTLAVYQRTGGTCP